MKRWRWAAIGLVVAIAIGFQLTKAIPEQVSPLLFPFWFVTYRYGFVRRGLVGTVFRFFADGQNYAAYERTVMVIHYLLFFAVLGALVAFAVTVARRCSHARAHVFLATSALLVSALFPVLGTNAGYLDLFIISFMLAGAYLAWTGRIAHAGIVTAVAPAVHDGFIFLWLPVMLLVLRDAMASTDRRAKLIASAPIALPVLTTVLVLTLSSTTAAMRIVDEIPLPYAEGTKFPFNFSLHGALDMMARLISVFPDAIPLAVAIYAGPVIVVLVAAADLHRSGRIALSDLFIALSPLTILATAWDLSRFVVWLNLAAWFVLTWSARRDVAQTTGDGYRRAAGFALVVFALLDWGGPTTSTYFDVTFAWYSFKTPLLRNLPAASIARAWIHHFNRRLYVDGHPRDVTCTLLENPPDCRVHLEPGKGAASVPLWLQGGEHHVTLETIASAACDEATLRIQSDPHWRNGPEGPFVDVRVRAGETKTSPIPVDDDNAATGPTVVVVHDLEGCLDLREIRVSR